VKCPITLEMLKSFFLAAELLFESGGHLRAQAHHHLCAAPNRAGRGAYLRLQIPIRG